MTDRAMLRDIDPYTLAQAKQAADLDELLQQMTATAVAVIERVVMVRDGMPGSVLPEDPTHLDMLDFHIRRLGGLSRRYREGLT